MRRGAKSNRKPLAPLHNNSLRADAARAPCAIGKNEARSSAASRGKTKLDDAERKLTGPASADLLESKDKSQCKTGTKASPTKARKSSQLVTTSAASRSETLARIKKAVKKPAGNASAGPAAKATSAASRLNAIAVRRQAAAGKPSSPAQPALPEQAKPEAEAAVTAPVNIASNLHQQPPTPLPAQQDGKCSLTPAREDATASAISCLNHWHLPATPPSISALLGPLESPQVAKAPSQDVQ